MSLFDRIAGLLDDRAALADPFHAAILTRLAERTRGDVVESEGLEDLRELPLDRLRREAVVARDFRDLSEYPRNRRYPGRIYGWPENKRRGRPRGRIPWDRITTIVLHTAGVREAYDDRGHPRGGMHVDRWLGVPCHAAVANDGRVVLCHDLDRYLYAAHAANRYSCSIEIAGNSTIHPSQIQPARALLRYVAEELRRMRPGPVKLIPHRFAHRSRARDCGGEPWQAVGEWGLEELGLELGEVVGSGRGLPWGDR